MEYLKDVAEIALYFIASVLGSAGAGLLLIRRWDKIDKRKASADAARSL